MAILKGKSLGEIGSFTRNRSKITSKPIPDQDLKAVDIISSSRYISDMEIGGKTSRGVHARFANRSGLLLQSDCLELLANIKSNSIDMVFADPPFNLGKRYEDAGVDDQLAEATYRAWCQSWMLESQRVLRPGGAFFLYHWPRWLMDLGAWYGSVKGMEFRNWIALKMKAGFPIPGKLHPAHYGLLYFVKAGKKPKFNVVRSKTPTCRHCGKLIRDYGGYLSKYHHCEEDGVPWVQVSDFWEDTRPATFDKARAKSINELPLHIPERAILLATDPGDTVLDFFSGSGSTLHAAQRTGRRWISGDFGVSEAALRRIKTVVGSGEVKRLDRAFGSCIHEDLREILERDLSSAPRPVAAVETIPSFENKEARDFPRSRVFQALKQTEASSVGELVPCLKQGAVKLKTA